MRSIFLFGGFIGFALVAVVGLLSGRSGDRVLCDAAIGALLSAMMFRWFWQKLIRVLAEAVTLKRAARHAVEQAAAAAAKAGGPSPVKAK